MATVTSKLVITSADLVSNPISLTLNTSITASHTSGLARAPITSIAKATASGQVVLYTALDFAATAYLYIKNTDLTLTDYIYVYADTAADDPILLKLGGGHFAYLPLSADTTLKAYAATSGTIVEYMVFGTDI